MNIKLIRSLSALITASMIAAAVPCVSAADMPEAEDVLQTEVTEMPAEAEDEEQKSGGNEADEAGGADEADGEPASQTPEADEEEALSEGFTVASEPVTDSEKIKYAQEQLKLLNFSEDKPKVTTISLHLPTTITTADESNVKIEWVSGDEEWMLSDGTLVKQPEKDSHIITMTATITSGEVSEIKNYEVAIKAYEEVKSFPGAQGYGTQTRGGAYGYVYHVTTLAADGPGSLKEAVEEKDGARTIVFDVGGTIDLTSNGKAIVLKGDKGSNVTIAGQTAPGEGIQLKGYGINLSNVHDVIIRNISIRIGNVRKAGDTYQSDPLTVSGNNKRIVLDHISMCWGVDMGFRVDGKEVTMSNCMISKGLYWNTPHEKGKHNYAGMFRANYGTFYGNYIADCGQRAPRIIDNEYIDVRNNVVANSKYTFDICNYEWMGANPKFNIVNNMVLKGNPNPGGSSSNVTSAGSYKYFQGRTYSGGLFTYTINNYDNTSGARAVSSSSPNITGGLWNGQLKSGSDEEKVVGDEMASFSASGYSNIASPYQDMIFPGDISLSDYNSSLVSKQGNTLMPYPFVAAAVKTYTPQETAKYVLTNAGSRSRIGGDILTRRYLAEGRTRLMILSDFMKGAKCYGIELPEDYDKETAYGLDVHTETKYLDKNGMIVYDIDGGTVTDLSDYTVDEVKKYVTMGDKTTHLDSLYAIDPFTNQKYLVELRDYKDTDDVYDAFDIYDIDNNKLTKPSNYASVTDGKTDDAGVNAGMSWNNGSVYLKWCDWGDGAGNYDHESGTVDDGYFGSDVIDTEWNEYDWPQLPTVYRDGKWDSNNDGIPDFYVKLMGWGSTDGKDISREDFEGRGYTNLEYYINDCCAGDQEPVEDINDDPAVAENVRSGSSKFDTHNSHEILFNTVKRAKAKLYVCEGSFNEETAKEITLNKYYDYDVDGLKYEYDEDMEPVQSKYRTVTDFDTYFSYVFTNLKPETTYTYKIKTYNDLGVEYMSDDIYSFTTKAESTGKPGTPRVTKYIPFDKQITLEFEPASENKSYLQKTYSANSKNYNLTYLKNNKYDTKTDHFVIRYSRNADMTDAQEITVQGSETGYVITGLENGVKYYVDVRAVSADGTESDSAIFNQKQIIDTGKLDKDGNKVYEVKKIEVKDGSVVENVTEDDVLLKSIAIEPTRYAINVNYEKELLENDIKEGETTKFTTVFGDVKDWYIYTLGGIPIPSYADGYENPILMLRDESHDHGFTYAKTFETPLSGKSTIRCRLMIKDEVLDPMNQNPELRFYLQQDSAASDDAGGDEGEGTADTGSASDAAVFGTIASITFAKNDINYDGKAISRYTTGTWYDLKLLMDGDNGTIDVYINDKLIRSGLEYQDSATSNTIARWQISSRLAGTEDVYIAYMYAYTGWDEPISDPDATPAPDTTVQEGTSGSRPSAGGGGGGGGTVIKPTSAPEATAEPEATADPEATVNPNASAAPDTTAKPTGFRDMDGYDWAVEPVLKLNGLGIVNGISDTEFAPGRSITRAEFAAILMRGFDLIDENAECGFADVKTGDWYYSAVASAYKLGIVNGISDTAFGSSANISRQDMAVMIMRLLDKLEIKLDKVNEYEKFADDADIADYAKDAVAALYEAGIIDGVGDNRFAPAGTANRAAAAKVLYGVIAAQQENNGEE
ncbi:MAG: S-layer homology domain-containing protein [Candidatus Ornithomonoglobus sp.]